MNNLIWIFLGRVITCSDRHVIAIGVYRDFLSATHEIDLGILLVAAHAMVI